MRIRLLAGVLIVVGATFALSGGALAGGRPLSANLSGANEVPSGDPDGFGKAELRLNRGQGEICLTIDTEGIATPILQHIHRGPAGVNGPVVVNFTPLLPGGDGCVTAPRDLIKEIRKNPDQFYFNVHTGPFPGGAIRGQLEN